MAIKLEDYEDFLTEAAPEIRDVLESTSQEAITGNVTDRSTGVHGRCQKSV